jgi:aspartate/tyrosine/aromatic aminotransferase
MFETLDTAPPDAILGLTEAFQQDPNPQKINLTVGVYKDAQGTTPVLECVKEAERRLLESESSKGYLAIDGMPQYDQLVRELLFGPEHEIIASQRAATAQTPGGTSALRVAADLLSSKFPGTRIWVSNPTWANHPNVFKAAGLELQPYGYIDEAGTGLDFDAMLTSLKQIPRGDVLLLHACCHNPTGIDPTPEQWQTISEVVGERELLPLVDFAYHGFGHGLAEDAAGLLELTHPGREMLVCSSFSKNFGLYGERVGALTIVAGAPDAARAALSHAKKCIRSNYSNPPRHGAAIVATILSDPELRGQWEKELAAMRDRINGLRHSFAETMSSKAPGSDFSFITRQCGMFSYSGLNRMQVDRLRSEYSIYVVGDGRMNVAGMSESSMDRLCTAVAAVL